jgi:hypothetical protein
MEVRQTEAARAWRVHEDEMRTRATSRLTVDRRPRAALDTRAERVFRQAVAHEVLLARETARDRTFDPTDARWQLATETQRALQGAVLAFEDRRRLLALANRLGIRAFDANLILALVQDRARRGEPLEAAAATIEMIPKPLEHVSGRKHRDWTPIWIAALLVAMAVDALLIAWMIFG